MRRVLLAGVLGLLGTALAAAIVMFGGTGPAVLGGALRDRWAIALAPVSPGFSVVIRDPAAEQKLGAGAWDRAVIARVIGGLTLNGATAIGIDASLGSPSPPGRGGAASDALLREAIAQAADVVYLLPPVPGPVPGGVRIGHPLAPPDPDGVVRRVPLTVRAGERGVLSFGLALAATALRARPDELLAKIPTDAEGRAVLRWAPDLQVTQFSELWTALERGDTARVRSVAEGKAVLVATEPLGLSRPTPIGPLWDVAIQAEFVNATLTRAWLRETPLAFTLIGALVLAEIAAWMALGLRSWRAPLAVLILAAIYAVAFAVVPSMTGLVLPALLPVGAILIAGGAASLLQQFGAAERLRNVEAELAGIRETLVRRESTVEALEEDLEAARAAVARSTGTERDLLQAAEALKAQLAEAQTQEEQTRARLQALERETRPADRAQAPLADVEQERLGKQAAELGIVTREPAMLRLVRDLMRAARATLPIVLAGEPGTGKELFARAAHRLSARASGPFVAVNMAAVAPELFESELFGHVKGSFTGAVADRKGYFEQADRGTIFLDEIGELRADHQGKLLRVLQEKSFYRVGAAKPTAVDVRVVAASNRDLARGVSEGWFREDLYFRLKGLVLELPPLRDRRRDIEPLAARFLAEAAAEAQRTVSLSEAALQALERHDWPGNVRELQNTLRRAVALSERAVLAPDDLGLAAAAEPRVDSAGDAAVLASLRQHAFDMQATARALGWDRSTVTQRLKGLGFRAIVDAGGGPWAGASPRAGGHPLAPPGAGKPGE
jgi:transcriptional regulator with PAS, ATPase and Fis domain/CHASE2 domain-containing sensor protein